MLLVNDVDVTCKTIKNISSKDLFLFQWILIQLPYKDLYAVINLGNFYLKK